MLIKYVKLFMISQCLIGFISMSTYATEYNHRILDMRADTFNERIWSRSEFTTNPREIEESLDFLTASNPSTGSMSDFKVQRVQFEQTMGRLTANELGNYAANNFKALIEACQEVYNTGEATKITGVNLLFQAILSKSSSNIKRIERHLKMVGDASVSSTSNSKGIDYFLHADKSQPLVTSSIGVF